MDFGSPAAAAKALTLNGSLMPNSTRPFKLNWASGGGLADRRYAAYQSLVSYVTNQSLGMTVVLNIQFLLATLDLKWTNMCLSHSFSPDFPLASPLRLWLILWAECREGTVSSVFLMRWINKGHWPRCKVFIAGTDLCGYPLLLQKIRPAVDPLVCLARLGCILWVLLLSDIMVLLSRWTSSLTLITQLYLLGGSLGMSLKTNSARSSKGLERSHTSRFHRGKGVALSSLYRGMRRRWQSTRCKAIQLGTRVSGCHGEGVKITLVQRVLRTDLHLHRQYTRQLACLLLTTSETSRL